MDFTNTYSPKLLLRFLFPVALAAIFENIYSLVSVSLVSHVLDTRAVAVIGSCSPVGSYQSSLVNGISFGIGIYLGRSVGSHDEQVFSRAFTGSVALGALLSVIALFLIPFAPGILTLLSVPQELRADADTYVVIVLITTVFLMFQRLLMVTLQSFGDAEFMSLISAASVVVNTLLTWLLIGVLRFPVWGSALSAMLTHLLMLTALFIYCMKRWRSRFRLTALSSVGRRVYWELAAGSGAKTGMFLLGSFGRSSFQVALNRMDTDLIAGYTFATTLYNLLMAGAWELGTVSGVVTGQNEGCGNLLGIRRYNRCLVRFHVIYTLTLCLLLQLPAAHFIRHMAGDSASSLLIAAGTRMLRIYLIAAPLLWVVIFRNALQAIGAHGSALVIGLLHFATCFVGSVVFSRAFGFDGLCMVYPFSWLLQSIFAWLRYRQLMRRREQDVIPLRAAR